MTRQLTCGHSLAWCLSSQRAICCLTRAVQTNTQQTKVHLLLLLSFCRFNSRIVFVSVCMSVDHLAQCMELLGDIPEHLKFGGKYSNKLFSHRGDLRHIKSLQFWDLEHVLVRCCFFVFCSCYICSRLVLVAVC